MTFKSKTVNMIFYVISGDCDRSFDTPSAAHIVEITCAVPEVVTKKDHSIWCTNMSVMSKSMSVNLKLQ